MINPISPSADPLTIMQKSLDALATQHNAIANNIANIDTPNFKRSVVTFQDQLKLAINGTPSSSMWRTNPMHMPVQESALSLENFQPTISTISDTMGRNDGNNVDMEMESSLMAQNNLVYNALADVTTGYFADLRHAISEGKS